MTGTSFSTWSMSHLIVASSSRPSSDNSGLNSSEKPSSNRRMKGPMAQLALLSLASGSNYLWYATGNALATAGTDGTGTNATENPAIVTAMIGVVEDGASTLEVQDQFVLPLAELRTAHTSTLPAIFASR